MEETKKKNEKIVSEFEQEYNNQKECNKNKNEEHLITIEEQITDKNTELNNNSTSGKRKHKKKRTKKH